jgi:hypothetical protein
MACSFEKGEAEQYLSHHEFLCQEAFNYYLDHPACHTMEKHGPQLTVEDLKVQQAEKEDPNKAVTHFFSREALENCRIAFLETFRDKMERALAENKTKFEGTCVAEAPVGEGLLGLSSTVHEVYLFTFMCKCDWTREHWSEITGFPDLKLQSRLSAQELKSFTTEWRAHR